VALGRGGGYSFLHSLFLFTTLCHYFVLQGLMGWSSSGGGTIFSGGHLDSE